MNKFAIAASTLAVACTRETPAPPDEDKREVMHGIYVVTDRCVAEGAGTPWETRPHYAAQRDAYVRLTAESNDTDLLRYLLSASLFCDDFELAATVQDRMGPEGLPSAEFCVDAPFDRFYRCLQRRRAVESCCTADACATRPGCPDLCTALACP